MYSVLLKWFYSLCFCIYSSIFLCTNIFFLWFHSSLRSSAFCYIFFSSYLLHLCVTISYSLVLLGIIFPLFCVMLCSTAGYGCVIFGFLWWGEYVFIFILFISVTGINWFVIVCLNKYCCSVMFSLTLFRYIQCCT